MSNIVVRSIFACGLSGLAIFGLSSTVESAGFYVREQSVSAMTTGFAGSASRGTDSSHLFFNPATIIENEKLDITGDFRLFHPHVEIDRTTATSALGLPVMGTTSTGNMANLAIAPSFFASYAVTDRFSVGIGGTGPFAVVIDSNPMWAGRFHLLETDMRTYNVNPVVAFKVAEWLTVGAGLQAQYFDAELRNGQIFPVPPAFVETVGFLEGDSWDFGFTAGALLKPIESTTIGVGYRSRIKHELDGSAGVIPTVAPIESTTFDITTPDVLTASISHRFNDYVTVHGTFEWVNWSLFKDITVEFASGRPNEVRPQDWEDTYSGFVGASVMVRPNTTISAGAGYTTAVSDGTTTSISPDGDRTTVAVGLTQKISELATVKVSYAHVFFSDTDMNIVSPTAGTMRGQSNIDLDILGASLTLTW